MIDRLANPEALALLVLVPVAAWGLARRRRAVAMALPSRPGPDLPRTWRARLVWVPAALRVLGLIALVGAIARPQDVEGVVRTRTEGVAIQIVVDRSGSMDEPMEDGGREVRKMDVVKRVLESFILGEDGLEPREGDMIGLIAFARYADTICPLVRGRDAVAGMVRTLDIVRQRSEDGTAIGDALALAAARLRRAEEELRARGDGSLLAGEGGSAAEFEIKSKVIVLLTDGVNNAGTEDPIQVARLAAEWGIRVYVIGVGAGPRMATVRTPLGERRMPVGPSLDERALRAIAQEAGGRYFPASSAEALRDIYEQIGRMERSQIHILEHDEVTELFGPLAAAACLLLALEALLAATWFRRGP